MTISASFKKKAPPILFGKNPRPADSFISENEGMNQTLASIFKREFRKVLTHPLIESLAARVLPVYYRPLHLGPTVGAIGELTLKPFSPRLHGYIERFGDLLLRLRRRHAAVLQ
jgi:hypothetical protein